MWWPVPRLSLLFCSFLASDSVDMRFSSSWELVAPGCPTASLRMHRLTSHSEQSEQRNPCQALVRIGDGSVPDAHF